MFNFICSFLLAYTTPFLAFFSIKYSRAGFFYTLITFFFLLCLPFIFVTNNLLVKYAQVSFCTMSGVKTLDLLTSKNIWRAKTLKSWWLFFIHPFRFGIRSALSPQFSSRMESFKMICRGAVPILAGIGIFILATKLDLSSKSFWLDHTFKVIAFLLFCFDGLFVFLMGFYRFLGGNSINLSNHPLRSATPAEFWRSYNRMASDYFNNYYYRHLKNKWAIAPAVMVTFLISGAIHVYMLFALTSRFNGYILTYFILSGIATVLTLKVRPEGIKRKAGICLTLAYHYFSLYFLFMGYNDFFKIIYPKGGISFF